MAFCYAILSLNYIRWVSSFSFTTDKYHSFHIGYTQANNKYRESGHFPNEPINQTPCLDHRLYLETKFSTFILYNTSFYTSWKTEIIRNLTPSTTVTASLNKSRQRLRKVITSLIRLQPSLTLVLCIWKNATIVIGCPSPCPISNLILSLLKILSCETKFRPSLRKRTINKTKTMWTPTGISFKRCINRYIFTSIRKRSPLISP